jgi:hypothetical protein
LLLISVATSGTGLFFVVAAATFLLLSPGRWRQLVIVIPAVAAYAAWMVVYNRDGSPSWAWTVGHLRALAEYVRDGTSFATGAVLGLDAEIGLVVAVLLVVATMWRLLGHGGNMYLAMAAVAGLLASYALTGLARAEHPGGPAEAPRYAYPAAAFLLLAFGAWYGSRPLRRPIHALPLLGVALWAIASNAVAMDWWADWYKVRASETRAAVSVMLDRGGTPELPGELVSLPTTNPFLNQMPGPDGMRTLITKYGSPLDDAWQPGTFEVPPETYAQVEADILASAGAAAAPDG